MPQTKEQEKPPGKELSEMETRNVPGTEFQTMAPRMLKRRRERVDELSRDYNKETVSTKRGQKP